MRFSEEVKRGAVLDVASREQAAIAADNTGAHPRSVRRRCHGQAVRAAAAGLGIGEDTLRAWIHRYGPAADDPGSVPRRAMLTPLTDSERLIRRIYSVRSALLFDNHHLVPAGSCPDLSDLAPVRAGVTVAASSGFTRPAGPATVVSRLPIGSSRADTRLLRYDFVTDLVLALTTATHLAADCLLYLRSRSSSCRTGAPAAAGGRRSPTTPSSSPGGSSIASPLGRGRSRSPGPTTRPSARSSTTKSRPIATNWPRTSSPPTHARPAGRCGHQPGSTP